MHSLSSDALYAQSSRDSSLWRASLLFAMIGLQEAGSSPKLSRAAGMPQSECAPNSPPPRLYKNVLKAPGKCEKLTMPAGGLTAIAQHHHAVTVSLQAGMACLLLQPPDQKPIALDIACIWTDSVCQHDFRP